MSVRLTQDARILVHAASEWDLPFDREGFNECVRRNPLFGGRDGYAVRVATAAAAKVSREALIALAHADLDYRHEDFKEDDT